MVASCSLMASMDDVPNLRDLHVLVLDDHQDTLDVFSTALRACNANVFTARTARDAVTIFKTVRLDAIVSDLAMPGEDGLWVVDQLRRLSVTKGGSVPALAVTADVRTGLSGGADERDGGDAAAALLFGEGPIVAEPLGIPGGGR